jgi:hypothetical protein
MSLGEALVNTLSTNLIFLRGLSLLYSAWNVFKDKINRKSNLSRNWLQILCWFGLANLDIEADGNKGVAY